MRSERIGHFAADVAAYLCVRDQEKPSSNTVDIIGCPLPVCNSYIYKMWSRISHITPGAKLWNSLDFACRFFTRSDAHHIKLSGRSNDYKLFLTKELHLNFTDEEKYQGQELLKQLGVPTGTPWICIHNRDAAYLNSAIGEGWEYHNFRDFSVQTMLMAADELSARGYYVLRMGAIVAEKLVSDNKKIIDYASSKLRSDFADIYLLAKCTAYIGSDAGIACVPMIFRKPVVYINHSMTMLDSLINEVAYPMPFITKHLWHKGKQRFLSLREMYESGLADAARSSVFEKADVEVVSNKPEEIRDLAVEVDERLKGNWQTQPEDEELQQKFWSIFRQYHPTDNKTDIKARIGASFLRNNIYLLD